MKNIKRIDIYIAIALFLLTFMIHLPVLDYPLSGDSVIYAELTKNLHDTGTYTIDGKLHTQYPFLFPLVSAIFMLFGNHLFAIKISAFFWASLVVALIYLLSLRFIGRKFAVLTALLTLFNPWFFYFTTALPLSEAMTTFLIISAFLLYDFEDKNKHNYCSAFFFGLAILSRYTAGIFALPFLIANAVKIIKELIIAIKELIIAKQSTMKQSKLTAAKELFSFSKMYPAIIFILLVLLPALLWLFFTIINTNDISTHGYIGPLLTQSSLTFNTVVYNSFLVFVIIPILLLFGMIFLFIYMLYKILYKIKTAAIITIMQENSITFWEYILTSFSVMLLFGIFWFSIYSPYFPYIWEKLRFFVSFIPFLILFSMIGFQELLQRYIVYKKILIAFLFLFLFISLIAASYITFGFFKEKVDTIFPSREIFTQKAYLQSKAIAAINSVTLPKEHNVQQSIIVILSEQSIRDKEHKQLSYFFDIPNVLIMNNKSEILGFKGDKNKALGENNRASGEPFVYTEYSLDETKKILAAANISCMIISKIKEYGRIDKIGVYSC